MKAAELKEIAEKSNEAVLKIKEMVSHASYEEIAEIFKKFQEYFYAYQKLRWGRVRAKISLPKLLRTDLSQYPIITPKN